jgi:hypothetical protein
MEDESGHDSRRVVVLDIETGMALQIASGLFVIGWMTTSP